MIVFEIDIGQRQPNLSFVTELGGEVYRIDARWRDRREAWYLDLYDASDTALVRGQRLGINNQIMLGLVFEGLPEGKLALVELDGTYIESNYDDFGERCKLYYLEPSEVVDPAEINVVTQTYTIAEVA